MYILDYFLKVFDKFIYICIIIYNLFYTLIN